MIEDPIHLLQHPNECDFNKWRADGKKEIFFTLSVDRTKQIPEIIYLLDLDLSHEANYFAKFVFYIGFRKLTGCWANSRINFKTTIRREDLIKILIDEYPSYFEWFLWNPGWL